MLVLTRKQGEKILIGDDIVITVLDVRGDSIRLGVDAPRGISIQRAEILKAVTEANLEANLAADRDDQVAADQLKSSLGLLTAAPPPPQPPTKP
ncbi:carbon storage regulator CsrA [Cryobacterium adonitolivorans]|uniref:Translational regulator CsrA n=1 Tax=Cryobacterium adonitolivorans TaxID=1259189 RepID=A0A4R8W6P3_9MICO|nr:carbon storage regulator CsrA [Cryobacterium adonitolivorans]TFC02797.1 carbon storage regulator CsrA [Cryobacterium adonitolivorans]